jgi:hypothetical protein
MYFVSESAYPHFIPYLIRIMMLNLSRSYVLGQLFLSLLSMMLMSSWGDRAVQAQSLSQNEPPANALPTSDQPMPSVPLSNEAPDEPTRPRQPRRFVGMGGSIGVSGEDTGSSEGGFAVMTRNDLNERLSIRGTTVFGSSRTDNTVALTVNFPVRAASGETKLVPFVGGGVLISSESLFNDVIIRGLVTGGVDLPLSRRFVATTAVNVGFTDTTNIGVRLGVMYGF